LALSAPKPKIVHKKYEETKEEIFSAQDKPSNSKPKELHKKEKNGLKNANKPKEEEI